MASENSTEIQCVTNVLNTYLRWKSLNGPPRGHEIYHPSAFGNCLRKMQYQRYVERGHLKVEPEMHEAKTVRIFDTGHTMHARWTKYWEDLGVLRGVWECNNPSCGLWDDLGKYIGFPLIKNDDPATAVPPSPRMYGRENRIGVFKPTACACGHKEFKYHEITVSDKEMNFRGHVDQVLDFSNFGGGATFKKGNPVKVLFKDEDLPKKPIVNDMKSINSFGYKSKLEGGNVPFGYKVQVNIYLNLLDLDYGMLYFENKDDCQTKAIQIHRDPELWAKIREQAFKMNDMVDDLLLPPPRPYTQEDYECKYCEFRSICHTAGIWNDPGLTEKRRSFYGDFY